MLFGSLEIVRVGDMFTFTFNGPKGSKDLGAASDLKAFAEGRLASGMMSPELAVSLQELKEIGDAHAWKFEAMCAR